MAKQKGLTIILTGGILMKNFKKLSVLAAAALMAVAFLAAGCGSDSQTTASSDKNVTSPSALLPFRTLKSSTKSNRS